VSISVNVKQKAANSRKVITESYRKILSENQGKKKIIIAIIVARETDSIDKLL
jgi:hypothetical protein